MLEYIDRSNHGRILLGNTDVQTHETVFVQKSGSNQKDRQGDDRKRVCEGENESESRLVLGGHTLCDESESLDHDAIGGETETGHLGVDVSAVHPFM